MNDKSLWPDYLKDTETFWEASLRWHIGCRRMLIAVLKGLRWH